MICLVQLEFFILGPRKNYASLWRKWGRKRKWCDFEVGYYNLWTRNIIRSSWCGILLESYTERMTSNLLTFLAIGFEDLEFLAKVIFPKITILSTWGNYFVWMEFDLCMIAYAFIFCLQVISEDSILLCGKWRQRSAVNNFNFKTCLKMSYSMISFIYIMLTSFTFIGSFLCTGDCAKPLGWINSFNPHDNDLVKYRDYYC